MTRFLIASDSHKHLMTAEKACESIARGIREALPEVNIQTLPLADGGEGTIDAMVAATAGRIITETVADPLCRRRVARFGLIHNEETAVIEIAEAAGSALLAPQERQTMVATSYGVGELIHAAICRNCTRIIVGLGGCIASDMGLGMAQALGVKFYDRAGRELRPYPGPAFNSLSLMDVHRIELDAARQLLEGIHIEVASDVDIPLLGPKGQAYTFGPQKGASASEIAWLDKGFSHLAERIALQFGIEVDVPLAGAAGGMAAGLMGFLEATLRLGAELVAESINLEAAVDRADIVVVGEGCLDSTTLLNKSPSFVATLARSKGKPVIAVVGRVQPHFSSDIFTFISSCFDFSCNVENITHDIAINNLINAAKKSIHMMNNMFDK